MDMHNRIWTPHPKLVRWLKPALVALVSLVVACALPMPALAGQYHVYSCRTPSGETAPTGGWNGSATGSSAIVEETCSQPDGGLVAALKAGSERSKLVGATWAFVAPVGETIVAATLWRAGDVLDSSSEPASYQFVLAAPEEDDAFEYCIANDGCPGEGDEFEPLSSENRVVVQPSLLETKLFAGVQCAGGPGDECLGAAADSHGFAAALYIYAADVTLEQTAGPTASSPAGELASAATVSGTSHLAFQASDPGSGVYQAVFSVDGQVVQSTVLDEDEGRCRNVGQTTDGLWAFLYVQPCPASLNAYVGFNTALVPNGEHHLVVNVTDAAGNSALVLERNVMVDNPLPTGGPNGTNASAQASLAVGWKGAKGTRLARGYGHAETVVGRLTGSGGAAIAGAHVEVLSTADYTGAHTAATSNVVTEADGDFTLHLPPGVSSRTLRFEYSDELGGPPVVTKTLLLSVRAGVTLTVAPHRASVGGSIYFSGRLRGGPVPAGGKPLVLEARSPGGAWLEFDVIRSDARGRFHASYRFKFPGPANYQFRVLCEAEADYPYARGASNVVKVFER
jgi:hypothetical protein